MHFGRPISGVGAFDGPPLGFLSDEFKLGSHDIHPPRLEPKDGGLEDDTTFQLLSFQVCSYYTLINAFFFEYPNWCPAEGIVLHSPKGPPENIHQTSRLKKVQSNKCKIHQLPRHETAKIGIIEVITC